MTELMIFLIGIALGAFWLDTMRAREAACAHAKRICEDQSLQFLDDTVALERLRLERRSSGHLTLKRVYLFEFSDTGNNRREGRITVIGSEVTGSELEPYRELSPQPLARRQ